MKHRFRLHQSFGDWRAQHVRAFTLIEVLVVVAVIALLTAILLPALKSARKSARAAICQSHLSQYGVAGASYSADFQDRIFSFTWRSTDRNLSDFPDLNYVTPWDTQAAAAQAIDIMRRRSERSDLPSPQFYAWLPHTFYTHLVIQDYLAARIPEKAVVCPEDRNRLTWQQDPELNFDNNVWFPFQPDAQAMPENKRWPYGSSYETVPAAFDSLQSYQIRTRDRGVINNRLRQFTTHNQYVQEAGANFGNLKMADVAYPAQKVHMHDSLDRHYGATDTFFGYANAKQPILFFDASVRVYRSGDSNEGWDPRVPTADYYLINYAPELWEPPTRNGQQTEQVHAYYRWTRGGLKGIDFGGRAVNTGQPQ